jgi:hypothetical protein
MIEFIFVFLILIYLLAVILIFNDDCIGFQLPLNNFTIPILLFVPVEILILYGIVFSNSFVLIVGGIIGCFVGYCIVDCLRVGAVLIRSA